MQGNRSFFIRLVLAFCLVALLAACAGERKVKFVAPEIEPPADLIPGYVPEGFELVAGFKLSGASPSVFEADGSGERLISFMPASPAGNDILGVYYQSDDTMLLISKSYYPGGSLDSWMATLEGSDLEFDDCVCVVFNNGESGRLSSDCNASETVMRFEHLPELRMRTISEVLTVAGTQVAVGTSFMEGGSTTTFMRGDDLVTVEGGIALEENLKIVASLLGE